MELEEVTYQKTEFGLIPSDWSELNLGTSSTLKARIGWQGLTTAEYLSSGDYILVTGTDFKDGYIDWNNCFSVQKDRYDQDPYIQLKVSDVLVTKDGTIGKVAIVEKLIKPATLNSGVFVIRPKQNQYLPEYLYYVLRSNHFDSFIKKLTAGSTITHLYQKDFVHYKIPLPPTLQEQKAIATALSDVDNLITNLDKLIAKKKAIKQGAMQRLLKSPAQGGQRLPGFEGEWIDKTLDKVSSSLVRGPFGGALKKEFFVHSGYKVYEQRNAIYATVDLGNYFINEEKFKELQRFEVKSGDFIVSCSGTIGRIYQIPENYQKGVINQALLKITINSSEIDERYFFYQFTWDHFQNKVIDDTQGGAMKNLVGMDKFKKAEIPCPPSLNEQKAIASILSDMDKAIESIETKKSKYLRIKQGMMQELLTGKTRLV